MSRTLFSGILLSLLLGGCSAIGTPAANPQIRVANRSPSNFTSVRVVFPSEEVNYGAIAAGTASAYESVERAYRYAQIEVLIGERRLVLQPIDYVGETLLEAGSYTYALGLTSGGEQLTLELETN